MYHKRTKLFICPKSNRTFMLFDFAYMIFFIIQLTHNFHGAASRVSCSQILPLYELIVQECRVSVMILC